MRKLNIELANTYSKRETGLMKRKHLAQNDGMLFVFPQPNYMSFWMKDTYIPLDIAFLDDNGKILQIESMIPLSTKPVYSRNTCKYALEVNKGWFKDNDIKEGAIIAGEGIKNYKKIAQMSPAGIPPPSPTQPSLETLNIPPQNAQQPQQQAQQPQQPNPDVQLDLSFKEKFKNAEMKGVKLVIIYQTKKGIVLPPKVISPPFEFEKDAEGKHDGVVKAWDNQTGGWKSFLLDNIISLELEKTNEGIPPQKQEI